jgi:hypothetical protein
VYYEERNLPQMSSWKNTSNSRH